MEEKTKHLLTEDASKWRPIMPFVIPAATAFIFGTLMTIVARVWDRPFLLEWIHPDILLDISVGLVVGVVYLLATIIFNVKQSDDTMHSAIAFLISAIPMMLVWNVYSYNSFNWLSGLLTLAGFIVMSFAGVGLCFLCMLIFLIVTEKQPQQLTW